MTICNIFFLQFIAWQGMFCFCFNFSCTYFVSMVHDNIIYIQCTCVREVLIRSCCTWESLIWNPLDRQFAVFWSMFIGPSISNNIFPSESTEMSATRTTNMRAYYPDSADVFGLWFSPPWHSQSYKKRLFFKKSTS